MTKHFFEEADAFLQQVRPEEYALVAVDIENFRLFNKFYGREEGNKFLQYIADCVKRTEKTYEGIGGYLGGDNFCLIIPDRKEIIRELETAITNGIEQYEDAVGFYPVFGVYAIGDDCMSAIGFIVTGKIVGAESLVRWQHKTKGLVSPRVFIPVMEKNGMMDRNLFDDTMVNNIIGAAAFYEVFGDRIEITRVNEQYYHLNGVSVDDGTNYETKMGNHVREDDRTALLSIFQQAYENSIAGAEGTMHFLCTDGRVLWL